MQNEPLNNPFLPESIDEQIEQIERGIGEKTAESNLVTDLRSVYQIAYEEEQAIERIRGRLSARIEARSQLRHSQKERISQMKTQAAHTHAWRQPLNILAAAFIAALLVGSLAIALQMMSSGITQQPGNHGNPGGQPTVTRPSLTAGIYLGVNNQIVKLDIQTHEVLWRYTVKDRVPRAANAPEISARPIVIDGTVYFSTQDDRVLALDALTGRERWVHSFEILFGGKIAVAGKVVYATVGIGPEASVYALNSTDGRVLNQYKNTGELLGVFDGILYAGGNTDTLTAFKLADGSQLWQRKIDTTQLFNADLYAKNGVLYVSSHSTKALTKTPYSYVYTINQQSGTIRWQSPKINASVENIAVSDDEKVYCGAQNFVNTIYGFDPQAKKQLWSHPLSTGQIYSAMVVELGTVYVAQSTIATSQQDDHLIALDAATGTQKWAQPLQNFSSMSASLPPGFYNGVIYLATMQGLHGFSAIDGHEVVTVDAATLLGSNQQNSNASTPWITITIVS